MGHRLTAAARVARAAPARFHKPVEVHNSHITNHLFVEAMPPRAMAIDYFRWSVSDHRTPSASAAVGANTLYLNQIARFVPLRGKGYRFGTSGPLLRSA